MLKLQYGCNQRRGNDSKQCLYCKVALKFDGPVVTRQGDAEHALYTTTAVYTLIKLLAWHIFPDYLLGEDRPKTKFSPSWYFNSGGSDVTSESTTLSELELWRLLQMLGKQTCY
jgi:hypothetical protein